MAEHLKYSELSGGKRKKGGTRKKGGNALATYGTPALTYGLLSLLKRKMSRKNSKKTTKRRNKSRRYRRR